MKKENKQRKDTQKNRRDMIPKEVHRRASIVAQNLFQPPPKRR